MKSDLDIEVFSILEDESKTLPAEFKAVTINFDVFTKITGKDDQVEFPIVSKGKSKDGKITREFNINETPIWVRYNGKGSQYPNTCIMKTKDVERLNTGASQKTYEF